MDKWKTKPYDLLPLVCLDFGESFFRKGNSYQVYSVILNSKRLALSQELIGYGMDGGLRKTFFFIFFQSGWKPVVLGRFSSVHLSPNVSYIINVQRRFP